jgi:SagB-type dehydrogenase family enzyme
MDTLIDINTELLSEEGELWELFHVNSKSTRSDLFIPSEQMAETMRQMPLSFSAKSREMLPLPAADPACLDKRTVAESMLDRATPNNFVAPRLSLIELATLMHSCAGENRTPEEAQAERAFRVVPSGGAMYPMEVFVHCRNVEGVSPGIYHYDPINHALRIHVEGDQTDAIANTLVQPALPEDTSVHLIFSMLPSRLAIKYGDRGYRFAMMEAGHASQNAIIAARAMGYDAIPIGGYRDEEMEALLGLDGVNHVVGYLTFVGLDQDA